MTMQLLSAKLRASDRTVSAVAQIVLDGREQEICFTVPEADEAMLSKGAEAALAAMVVPAMSRGEDVHITPPVSGELLVGLSRVQDVLHTWYGDTLKRVAVVADPTMSGPQQEGVGCMFSGGVDSLYTFLRHMHERPVLLFGRGVSSEFVPEKVARIAVDADRVTRAAADLGHRLISYETNIRTLFPLPWGSVYHGAGLAASAHVMSAGLGRVYIPSTDSYLEFRPWGSHPLLDENYSTSKVRIVHDGSESTRAEKTAWIADRHPTVLKYLHVCILPGRDGTANCGRCWKCVRTMVALAAVGMLDRAPSFPHRLPANVQDIVMQDAPTMVLANLNLARSHGANKSLIQMLERATRRRRRKDALRELAETTSARHLLPMVRYLRRITSKKSKGS